MKNNEKPRETEEDHSESSSSESENEAGSKGLSKNDSKSHKAMSKLGLVPVPGISRVAFKKGRSVFAVSNPEVYKSPNNETFIVFGQAKMEDGNALAQAAALQQAQAAGSMEVPSSKSIEKGKIVEVEDEDEQVDATGLDPKDIEIVMNQANVPRSKAVNALKSSNNDLVTAIMELTM